MEAGMRLGVRNSGNSIRPWTARLLADAPDEKLTEALRQARDRRAMLLPTPDSPTKRTLIAREDWLIRCIEAERENRRAPPAAVAPYEAAVAKARRQ